MGHFPKINSIVHSSCILIRGNQRILYYEINEGKKDAIGVRVSLPEFGRPKISSEIIDNSNVFINGFKIVQTSNNEYAYIRQSDSLLLPFRYDVASDFNEYGFAMVGKDGSVSWIDTSFRYLNLQGDMIEEELEKRYAKFRGWQGVSSFSKGSIPLSRVYDDRNTHGKVSYFGINGKFKEFYQYNGEIDDSFSIMSFNQGTNFDENNRAIADGNMLFAKGYYSSYDDLIKICEQKGFITAISKDADKCFDKETGRVLIKLKPNNN